MKIWYKVVIYIYDSMTDTWIVKDVEFGEEYTPASTLYHVLQAGFVNYAGIDPKNYCELYEMKEVTYCKMWDLQGATLLHSCEKGKES